jgi:sulfatase maturation enzyme AslB (radical SAM superfamily)
MLNSREIKVLHVEPTDVCQAACPLCARETDAEFDKNAQHHLTFDQIVSVFDQHKIAQLDKMFMCGNYGDPAAGQHTLEIFYKFREINPTITLGMNTNGGLQNFKWWKQLASILNQPKDYVVFSIDGLEDTNHIYRRNVSWKKVIDNASAFIQAGGNAHWDMLVYQHNEHQVNDAIKLAQSLGFSWFRSKVSKRPLVNELAYPINWTRPAITTGSINCIAMADQSIYLDSQGHLHPCCWQDQISLPNDIYDLQASWQTQTPNSICKNTCTSNNQTNNFNNQWRLELALK